MWGGEGQGSRLLEQVVALVEGITKCICMVLGGHSNVVAEITKWLASRLSPFNTCMQAFPGQIVLPKAATSNLGNICGKLTFSCHCYNGIVGMQGFQTNALEMLRRQTLLVSICNTLFSRISHGCYICESGQIGCAA